MLTGMLVAARLRGIDLGRFWTAVFKLSAISVAPAAVVSLLLPALNYIRSDFFSAGSVRSSFTSPCSAPVRPGRERHVVLRVRHLPGEARRLLRAAVGT